jgi:hypothetical protein
MIVLTIKHAAKKLRLQHAAFRGGGLILGILLGRQKEVENCATIQQYMIVTPRIGIMKLLLLAINIIMCFASAAEEGGKEPKLSLDVEYGCNLESFGVIFTNAMPLEGPNKPVRVYVHIYQLKHPLKKATQEECNELAKFLKDGKRELSDSGDVILADCQITHLIHDVASDKYFLLLKQEKSWYFIGARKVLEGVFQVDNSIAREFVVEKIPPAFLK